MQLSDSYLAHSLRNTEVAGYRAGGVLLFSHMPTTSPGSTKAEPHVLIGKELRSSRSDPIGQLGFCLLGGKRDESDLDPAETALREFVEESGNVLTTSQKEQLRAQMTSPSADIFWYLPAKYCLYLLPLPPTATPGSFFLLKPIHTVTRTRFVTNSCVTHTSKNDRVGSAAAGKA
ncbi:hypothetical protein QOT17_024962 [Balamuthia mandrillaris]